MRIGIIHYKVGDNDGVSLEIDKWKRVLENMGHEVYLAGGHLGMAQGTLIEPIFHHSETAERLYRQTFIDLEGTDEQLYRQELMDQAKAIEDAAVDFLRTKKIELLVANNIWSVAVNPAAAIGTINAVRRLDIPSIAHNHDFYWERRNGVCLTSAAAIELADKYLPPRDNVIQHAVINTLAQNELMERKGVSSTVIPNVFDFESAPWIVDDYNRDFRERIGLSDRDVVILQATRIVARKGIELAIEFVRALGETSRRSVIEKRGLYDGRPFDNSSRIVFVLAGYIHDDPGGAYVDKLKNKIASQGIDAMFIGDLVAARRSTANGEKKYSLWDTYLLSDFVTYPSLWEGWGNQLLEAVRAKLPFLLNEYPVYKADISKAGFRAVSLGNEPLNVDLHGLVNASESTINRVADEALELLCDRDARQRLTSRNFEIGRERYSLKALQSYLEQLLSKAGA
jgi:glycosyltransferase involved in cell wall biosynthesis